MRWGYAFLYIMDSLLSLLGVYSLIYFVLRVCSSPSVEAASLTPSWPMANETNFSADSSRPLLSSPSLRQELALSDGALGDEVHSSWDAAIEVGCIANFIFLISALLAREAASLSVTRAKHYVSTEASDDNPIRRAWRLVRLHR